MWERGRREGAACTRCCCRRRFFCLLLGNFVCTFSQLHYSLVTILPQSYLHPLPLRCLHCHSCRFLCIASCIRSWLLCLHFMHLTTPLPLVSPLPALSLLPVTVIVTVTVTVSLAFPSVISVLNCFRPQGRKFDTENLHQIICHTLYE